MQDKVPDCITQMWDATNAEVRISHEILTWVGRSWDVDPMVFVNRKALDGARQTLDGGYMQQLAKEAERLLMKPARISSALPEDRLLRGLPYLYPQVEITALDAAKWLVRYGCAARDANSCIQYSRPYQGNQIRVVCLRRDEFGAGTGFATYKKGQFAGYLEDNSRLNGNDFIPVYGFGQLSVPPHLANKSRIEGTDGMMVILTLTDTIPEPILGAELGKIGYRIGFRTEVQSLKFPWDFRGAVGLDNFGYSDHPYAFIAPDGTPSDPFTYDHDFLPGTQVYAVKEKSVFSVWAEKP